MTKHNNRKNIMLRLSRAEGQVRALKQQLADVEQLTGARFLTQIKAVRSALASVSELYVVEYLRQCGSLPDKKRLEKTNEIIKHLARD